jgi:hypothetical protein
MDVLSKKACFWWRSSQLYAKQNNH